LKRNLNMDRIAKELGAERKGKVAASGGYFGAMQLVADIELACSYPQAADGGPTRSGLSDGLFPSLCERLSASRSSRPGSVNMLV